MTGTLAQQLAKMKEQIAGRIEEEGSENVIVTMKTAKKEKRVLRKDGVSLSQLKDDLGLGIVVPAVLRLYKEVKANC